MQTRLEHLYAAVTRKTLAGTPAEGWFPSERITIQKLFKRTH